MKLSNLYFSLCMITCLNLGYSANTNYYIHIQNRSVEIGEYSGGNITVAPYKTYSLDNLNEEEISDYLLGKKKEKVLYYIHCWLGNVSFYNKSSIRRLQELRGFDRMISIKWEGNGLSYKRNWFSAIDEGRKISQLMEHLFGLENKTNVLLCHSMGHRIFQGICEHLKKDKIYFSYIIFASADLPANILNKDLKDLPSMTEKILIYTHQKDRLLQISAFRLGQKRLGRINKNQIKIYNRFTNIKFTDVTYWPKNKWSPSNHIYFKDNDGVMEDMNKMINDK